MKKHEDSSSLLLIVSLVAFLPFPHSRQAPSRPSITSPSEIPSRRRRGGVKEAASMRLYGSDRGGPRAAARWAASARIFCTSGMTAQRLAASTAVLNDKTSAGYQLVKMLRSQR